MTKAGVCCRVVTETKAPKEKSYPFEVIRNPSVAERIRLTLWADIVHSNSASVAMWPYTALLGKPFIWTHNGYQVACIDGLGWEADGLAPIDPFQSFRHHLKLNGYRHALTGGFKLMVRRCVALNGVALNIPATKWVNRRLKLPKSIQAYTPYPNHAFVPANNHGDSPADFLYVGRLVSEKGVDTLILAFKKFCDHLKDKKPKIRIVGGGPQSGNLKSLAAGCGLGRQVEFTGPLSGDALKAAIDGAAIAVVPSIWEEPMGGVTLELMSAGKCLIVSANGGHAEVCGDAALTFPNGDAGALAARMRQLFENPEMQQELKDKARTRLDLFFAEKLTRRYIAIYRNVIED